MRGTGVNPASPCFCMVGHAYSFLNDSFFVNFQVEGMDENNARLDEYEIEHAFVLRSGSQLGI